MQTWVFRNAGAFVIFAIFTLESWLASAFITAIFQILANTPVETGLLYGADSFILFAIHPTESFFTIAKVGVAFLVASSLVQTRTGLAMLLHNLNYQREGGGGRFASKSGVRRRWLEAGDAARAVL